MNKVISRLLIFFVGIPLVLALVFFNKYNHLLLQLVIIAVSILASLEMYNILKVKAELLPKPLVVILSALLPLTAAIIYVLPSFTDINIPSVFITYTLIFDLLILLATEVFFSQTFEKSNEKLTSSLFVIMYAGFLPTFIQRMTALKVLGHENTDAAIPFICVFLLMVFLCDSLAWFFGVLLGKNNRGIVKASPNKSLAGFAGGFIGSILAGIAGYFIWSEIFSGSIIKIIVISILIAFSSIVGDLAESIFKRSSGVKDSGNIIPGRGGILDSIDSILMSAPVYYLLINIFYNIA